MDSHETHVCRFLAAVCQRPSVCRQHFVHVAFAIKALVASGELAIGEIG